MKKENLRRFVRTLAFCVLLVLLIAAVTKIVERKKSINKFGPFLAHAQAYDVLFMGDSHMVNAVFPMELWQDYGIASFNLASYGNTLPVSYWSLMNALDYAAPKLVVMDIKDIQQSYKLTGSSSDVHTTFDCYPLSRTKISAIEDLMDDPWAADDDGNVYADMKWEYYFTLGKYHSRWSELTEADFRYEPECQLGGEMKVGVSAPNDYDIIDENATLETYGYGFEYLQRMIETCQSRGIELLLVNLPYPSTEEDQLAANTARFLAEGYGVPFIDFVNLDQVVDYRTDCYDAFSHLNPSGARKVTDYLGEYLITHYALADHRDDAAYAHWNVDYDTYFAYKCWQLSLQDSLYEALMLLHDKSLSVCIAVSGDLPLGKDETLLRLMQNIPREHVYEEDAYSKWSDALYPLTKLDQAAADGQPYVMLFDGASGTVQEWTGSEGEQTLESAFGTLTCASQGRDASMTLTNAQGTQTAAAKSGEGITLLVLDARTGDAVYARGFDAAAQIASQQAMSSSEEE